MNPNVDVTAVGVSLVHSNASPVGRKFGIGNQIWRSDRTYLLATPVKPDQLRLADAPSRAGLCNQGLARHGEDGKVGLREILHRVTDNPGFTRQRVAVQIKALCDEGVVAPVD